MLSSLLSDLYNLGVQVVLENDKLKVRSTRGKVSKEILERIKKHKPDLIKHLRGKDYNVEFNKINRAVTKESYSLSSAQKRLYLLQQMDLNSTAYNMPNIISLRVEADKEKIEAVFSQLISRHESFRTSFKMEGEEPVQRIHEEVEFKLEEISIEKDEVEHLRQQFVQAFDLSKAPLLRAVIVNINGQGSLLMIDMHHIVSDGVSQAILEQDFNRLYVGETLVPLSLQYKDYSEWQNSEEQQAKVKKQEAYWVRKFEGEIPVLDLPADYARPVVQGSEGATVDFALSKEETQRIKTLAKENGLTLYMSLLSAFNILLSRLSGQEDVIVGMPIAGRNHPDLENIVGVFVNTLALRNEVNGGNTLKKFLGEVKQGTLDAFENQDYQFEELVENISVERDISRNPVFDVMFNLLNQAEHSGDISGLERDHYVHRPGISKLDLTLTTVDYGEQLMLSFEYCTKLFKAETIERYIGYFKQIVNQLAGNLDEKLSAIEIIPESEKQQLLYGFNKTQREYPRDKNLCQLFEEQVAKTPSNIALVFGTKTITYSELNKKSNQLARYLKEKGLEVGDIIGLMLDRSMDVLIGIFGILKAGGVYLPIDSTYPQSRINYIISNSESKIILSGKAHKGKERGEIPIAVFEGLDLYKQEASNLNIIIPTNNLSYIIYTSGSTGNPKGVQVEHSSVVNLLYFLQEMYPIRENDSYIFKTSYCFDVSVSELFGWILGGGKLSILEKDHEKNPVRIIEAINNFQVTHVNFVPTVFKLFSQSILPSGKEKLKSLKYILLAGEALLKEHLHEFNNLNIEAQVVNLYGPTEATVYTSHYILSPEDKGSILIGRPVSNYEVYIVDCNNQIQPVGVAGELLVGGEGLARGYLCNEELTTEKFIENPYKEGERLYKTGDLARWLPDGNIEFLGRIDHQVKIRGFRIELGEIENALLKHRSIKECVVLAREENGDKYLCAYLIMREDFNQEEIRTHLLSSLPDYMIPSYFVELDILPLTTNGKVNLKALPSPEIKAGDDYVVPSNIIEEKLLNIWSEVLNVASQEISVMVSFFAIGGHSLKASVLIGKIHKELDVEFPLRDVFIHSSIQAQAKQIEKSTKKNFVSIPKAKEQDYYPLSSAQKRLYLLQQMDLESTAYNMPNIMTLEPESEKEKIEEVFHQLIKRHESFRTSFEIEGEEPVQQVHEQVAFKLEEFNIEKDDLEKQRHRFIQAFDLSQAPLLRVFKVNIKGGDSLLIIDMHHIISDGVSHVILEQEYQQLYSGKYLPPLSLQYKDYSEWQNSEEQKSRVKDQEDYWIKRFEGEIPALNLPHDYSRPVIQSHEGASVSFILSSEETRNIKSLVKNNGLTLYMSILSVYSILLSKLSNQEDIVIGTPTAGRNHSDLEQIVGVFINTLTIRTEVEGSISLEEFLGRLKQNTLEAFENQDCQFEDLVEKLSIERDISRNPLFDVMFNFQNQTDSRADISGLEGEQYVHRAGMSKFDLTLTAVDYGEQLMLSFEYCTKLFKAETIERYINYFKQIVNQITQNLDRKLSEIEIITEEEKQQLLYEFNDTKTKYTHNKTIHKLFEEQVSKNPDNIAMISGERQISYLELHRKSSQLAQYLRYKGVRSNSVISLCFDPSLEMLISILGVLKSGAIYLPINPEINKERIDYIIADSGSDILLTHSKVNSKSFLNINSINVENIIIKGNYDESMDMKLEFDSAYIIYTSGTTGKPKGVLLSHKNLMNYFTWFNNLSKIDSNDKTMLVTSYSFDLGYTGLYSSLINGCQLHLVSKNLYLSPNTFIDYIIKNRISYLKLTSSLYTLLIDEFYFEKALKNLRLLVLGGEEINVGAVKNTLALKEGIQIINHYGPTEATIGCISYGINKNNINDYKNKPVIGKPINNTSVYILNKYDQIQPCGIQGELTVCGDGLAAGYINNPELTAEKFVPNPFNENEKLYHTGDLANRLPGGNIEFLGRIDNQVKIRGFRIELGEIESVLNKIENIKECVVIARKENGDKSLCAYIVSEVNIRQEEIQTYLSSSLPDYMIPTYFIQLEELPLTSNGKVNRKALPSPEIKADEDYVAPSNEIEEKLVEIWSAVLNIEKEEISAIANFFSIGGHSLKAAILTGKIHKELGVEIPLREVFIHTTIKSQAGQIETSTKKDFVSIPKAKTKPFYPLSSAQKRLYLLQQMDLGSTAYNMPYVIPLGEEVDKEKIEIVFQELIKRHESFRTSFHMEGEEPVQRIHKEAVFKLGEIEIEKEGSQEKQQQFRQAFDLSKIPLLRATIAKIKGEGSLLMIDMHHIISDGVSHTILERDFLRLYSGESIAPLSLQYKDYSEWQNSEGQQQKVKAQENYWVNKFEGELPVLNLPIDYVRPVVQSTEGALISFVISKEGKENINALAKENGLTLYMSILSVFNILLSKLSGQEEVIVGAPIAGRSHPDLEGIVGMFVNTLAIRNNIDSSQTFRDYLQAIKQNTLEAFENQEYQFEDLVEKVSIDRDPSRNPMFDVMFNLLEVEPKENMGSGALELKYEKGISKFDLTLTAVDNGEHLMLSFEYCTKLFKTETIERFIRYFKHLVFQLPGKLNDKLYSFEILSNKEKQELLYGFNETETAYPKDKTIHQLFEGQVSKNQDRISISNSDVYFSYKELNNRSNQLAWKLRELGVATGDIVGLNTARTEDLIIGILGILKCGAAYLPLNASWPKERISFMLSDTCCKILVHGGTINNNEFNCRLLDIRSKDLYEMPNGDLELEIKPTNTVYIIYTSGTTGTPKGVLTSHMNISRVVLETGYISLNNRDIILQLSSYTFDGSVFDIYGAMLNGSGLVMIDNESLLDIGLLLNIISRKQVSAFFLTTALFNTIVDFGMSKLKDVRKILFGGERISLQHTQRALKELGEGKLIHVYGPTETTVFASYYNIDSINESRETVPIGSPLSNTTIYLFDASKQVVPIGVAGEIYIGGYGNSKGYLNNLELTNDKFIPNPYKPEEYLYRTGDLARRLADGNIEFLGRIDHQVKIRGFRIELGEIESVLQRHESIKESVVLAREENGDKYLCAYLVTRETYNEEEIRRYISENLPDYMIPSYFVQLEKLPLTTNGKVNHKALPLPEVRAGEGYVSPSNEIEEKLVEIWSDVLNIEKGELSTTANFFSIGGHSLKASVLTGKIHKELGVDFPLRDVFLHTTIKSQAGQIETSTKKDFVTIQKAKEQEYYQLSSAQKRLYLLQQMDLGSTAYNMPYTIPLGEEVEKEKIEEVFRQLIKRHESFRTSFEITRDEPVQRIHEQVDFKIKEISIEKEGEQNIRNQFIQPFDLSQAPLLRVAIVKIMEEGSLLMIDMHHIISDGVSQAILEQDFQRLYLGEEIAQLSLQYKDYSEWQNSEEQQIKVKGQEDYWINRFEGEIPALHLPTDYIRPAVQSHEGASVSFALSKEGTKNIKSFASENSLTLYMSILTAFNILLSKLSGQEDIIIGTPIAGRNHTDLENIVGVFINTLAIRNEVNGNATLKEYIKKLKQTTLEAFENQEYQFEDLVEKVSVERDISRNPLFDVMFNLLNHTDYSGDLPVMGNGDYLHNKGVSKFDLGLTVVDYGDQLLFNFTYCTKLFKPESIDRFIAYLKKIINQLPWSLNTKLSSLEILSAEEKQQLLHEFNNTTADYPREKTIHQLFEEQTEQTPDCIALVYNEQLLTYKELNFRSNKIAELLISKGLETEDIVGILVDRSLEMIMGILGILKAGGTYLPLDIESPKERIIYIVKESKPRIILSQISDYKGIEFEGESLDLFEPSLYLNNQDQNINRGKSHNAAYIIYTSGSTGKPKGVIVEHGNVVNLVNGLTTSIYGNYHEILHVSLISPIYFDASIKQIFPVLSLGHCLEIIPGSIRFEGAALVKHYTRHGIQIADGTPFHAQMLAQYIDDKTLGLNIRQFIIGGDELKLELMQVLFQKIKVKDLKISNVYGPTECTDVTTIKTSTIESLQEKGTISIGKPISNYEIYILGKNLELLPHGVPGELCISGAGVSRGYLYNEKLTSEKFTTHPFKEGERLYRTGDLARLLPDGNIEFLGRIDHQVKIRGFRIELGEIENVLQKHENIKETVVIAREENGEKYLCAYLVTRGEFNGEETRAYLSESLPDYMIPSYFVWLEKIPLNSNGKVNRKALPTPEVKAGNDYVAPSNETEEKLVAIWSEVLNIEKEEISVIANFFSIGGHSLKVVILASRVHALFDVDITIKEIFSYPTIKKMAILIEASKLNRLEEENEDVDFENIRI